MKQPFWSGVALAMLIVAASAARAQVPAVVTGDRVNVRSRPSVARGEVVTQLARGQRVIVFEEGLPAAGPREPVTEWTRIELPAGCPVWVSARHVAMPAGTVRIPRLNVRAGPSEDYGVLGVVAQGSTLQVVEERDGWLSIKAPLGLSGYLASSFVEATEPPPATPGAPAPAPAGSSTNTSAAVPAPPPTEATPQADAPAPTPAPALDASPPLAGREPASPASAPTATEPAPVTAAGTGGPAPLWPADVEISPEPRIVHREGRVRSTLSVHAPTPFELVPSAGGRRMNYLLPLSTNIPIRRFRGQRVRVSGEEYLDPFWHDAPVIVVRDIKLAP